MLCWIRFSKTRIGRNEYDHIRPENEPKTGFGNREMKKSGAKMTPESVLQMAGCTSFELTTSDVTDPRLNCH